MSSTPREWKFRVRHMREAIDRIQSYTTGMTREELAADQCTLDAVVWNLTVLGEAPAKCLTTSRMPIRRFPGHRFVEHETASFTDTTGSISESCGKSFSRNWPL